MFTCTVSTQAALWVAQPYFTDPEVFLNDPSTIGRSISNYFGPSNSIVIRQVGVTPLVTVMVVQGSLINESFTASCLPQDGVGTALTNDTVSEESVFTCKYVVIHGQKYYTH